MRSALDPAFLRRLRFVVTFPYPGVAERQAIWQRAFPAKAQVGQLDWAHLAKLNLTGGNIATVALNAAFLATADGSGVEMRHVLAAARAEYVKLDRPFREGDFLVEVIGNAAGATERVA
jgi:SpoVK/Ycf46/Vps4 family AAA+-type ATPase